MSRSHTLLVVPLCVCLLPGLARAQAGEPDWSVVFAASGGHEITRSRVSSGEARLSGALWAGEVLATRRRLVARLRYGQGRLTNDTLARDVVEGEAIVGYKIRPWLALWVGPHARTFVVPGASDRRWLFWSGRLTARGSPFPGRVDTFVEVWQGFSGGLSRPAASANGGGLEAGVEARFAGPFRGRLAYRFEQGRVKNGPRETVEAFTVTITYAR